MFWASFELMGGRFVEVVRRRWDTGKMIDLDWGWA